MSSNRTPQGDGFTGDKPKTTNTHDGSGWCWYINANMTGVFVDGIHGAPYITAPWIRHGIYSDLNN